ncbi:MAG: transglycosylase SLT domain-containing protein [Neisseria sp.]|nr:transglycosylase SLT domain-containing protein [Neisseria sp.]
MTLQTILIRLALSALVLAACSSEKPLEPAATAEQRPADAAHFHLPDIRSAESPNETLEAYSRYEGVMQAAKAGDDIQPAQFLSRYGDSAMGEAVRNEWLKSLAVRGDWAGFGREYAKLDTEGRSQEVRCYAERQSGGKLAAELVRETGRLPAGCNRLLEEAARAGRLNHNDAWRRVRGLVAANQITDARALAAALGSPLGGGEGRGAQEALLLDIIGANAQKNPAAAAGRLNGITAMLTPEQAGFAWGVLGLAQAKNRNFAAALDYYNRAERGQLNDEQWEWYARAALRFQNWKLLASVIEDMPAKLQQNPAWLYWLARSRTALGEAGRAQPLYRQAAASGRNFYAVLATEELGGRIDTRNNVADAAGHHLDTLAGDGAIARALTLFKAGGGDRKMRRAAQAEWRYAVRGFNEDTKLAAAQLAYDNGFYEMAVNTADSTDHKINYTLRYISPFREITERYAAQAGIDPAWVYGLIRQESRFMIGAQSSVGAQGLMQVMPATAREIARKIGMDSSELYSMDGNIRMGTWYMADAKNRLQNNEVMATAGYNAGPGRARLWQADVPLEGAIYAETIPFNETRDYVKKVMTNATYYSSLFKGSRTSLKQRMGTVPAK